MVEENLSVLQEAADIARGTYEKKTSPYQPEADPVSVSTPAPEVQPTPVVTPAPVTPVVPTGPKPYEASDPSLVFYELNENPSAQLLNRIIYGEEMIDAVMDARSLGRLDTVRDAIVPMPEIQMMMSASGQSAQTIGLYLLQKGDPLALENLRGRIGESRFDAIERAHTQYSGVEEVAEPKQRGFLGGAAAAVGNEVLGLTLGADVPQGIAAGIFGFAKNITETSKELGLIDPVKILAFGALKNPSPQVIEALRMTPGLRQIDQSIEESTDVYIEGFASAEDYFVQQLDSFTGNFIAGATEFLTGWVAAPTKVVKGSSAVAQIANGAVKGAIVDGVTFDDEDGNLTSLLKELGWLESGFVIDFLSADEDDSKLEKFTATVLEGIVIGVGLDSLITGTLKGLKALNKGNVEEGIKLIDEAQTTMLREVEQDHLKFLEDMRTDAEKIEAGEYVPDFKLVDPDAPFRPDFVLVDPDVPSKPTAATKETPAPKPTEETPDTPAGDYQMPRPEAPASSVREGDAFIEFNKIPGFNEPDAKFIEDYAQYVKFLRRQNDLDKKLLNDLAGVKDLGSDLIYKNAEDLRNQIKDRVKAVFGKIQQPKDRFKIIAMAGQILKHQGADFLAKDLQEALNVDASKWSDEAAANLVASSILQDTLQEQYITLVSEIAAFKRGHVFETTPANLRKMFPNEEIKDVDDLRILKQAVRAKIAQLRAGNAKMASNAGRALRIIGLQKRADTKLARDQMKIQWQKEQGMINDDQEIKLLNEALQRAMKTKKGAAQIHSVIDKAESPNFLEMILRGTNAQLLTGLRTQMLMAGSNAVRVSTEGIIRLAQAPMDVMRAIRYWGDKATRQEALQSAKRSTVQGLLWYATMPVNTIRFFKAFGRFWKRGISDFDQRNTFDEDMFYAGKTLGEVFKEDPSKVMAAAEILYRFMGSVDEAFKEMAVMTDQQVRVASGEFGTKNQKAAWKVTTEDMDRILNENPMAVSGPDGRLTDFNSVERAKEAMFLFQPVEGSIRGTVQNWLAKRQSASILTRILAMRFVSVPLAVMESRFLNVFAPAVMAHDAIANVAGKGSKRNAKHWRVLMGKFADDLGAEGTANVQRRQRARAILALNSTLIGMAWMHQLNGGVDWINDDPTSPDYMKVRVKSKDGTERWSNVADFESPFNAFLIHYIIAGQVMRINDPTDATTVSDAGFAITTIMLNESLQKSSLANLMDTVGAVADPNENALTKFFVNQVAPFNVGGWYQRKLVNFARNNPFDDEVDEGYDGHTVTFMEALAKQIPPFRLVTNGIMNRKRNALGELIKPTNGVNPFLDPIQLDDPLIQQLELIQAQTGKDFVRRQQTFEGLKTEEIAWQRGQSVWDRAQQLIATGEVRVGGKTLREELEFVINSTAYQAGYIATREDYIANPTTPAGKKRASETSMRDLRVKMISDVLNTFRREAVLKAFETLAPEDKERIAAHMKSMNVDSVLFNQVYRSLLEQEQAK